MNKQSRISLLASCGHPTVLSQRAYPFLPKWVRDDLQRRLLISQAGNRTRHACSH